MLPSTWLVLAPAGQAPPSRDDLAGRFGVAVPLVIKAGTSAARLLNDGRVVEALRLRSSILLVFEDAGGAAAFERAAGLARGDAQRAGGGSLEQRLDRLALHS